MSSDKITISFKCGKCRSQITWPEDVTDSTEIFCDKCGESAGSYRELKKKAMGAAKKEVEDMMKKMFK